MEPLATEPLAKVSDIQVVPLVDVNGDPNVLGIALQFPPDLIYAKGLAIVVMQRYTKGIVDPADCFNLADKMRQQLIDPRSIKSVVELEHRQRLASLNWDSVAACVKHHIQDFNVKRWKMNAAEAGRPQ